MIVATCYVRLEREVKVTVTKVSKNKRKKHYMIVTSRNLVCLKRACSDRQDQTGRLDSQPKHDQCKIFFHFFVSTIVLKLWPKEAIYKLVFKQCLVESTV